MKNLLIIILCALALNAAAQSCTSIAKDGTTADGGFCISLTETPFDGTKYPGMFEYSYRNPDATADSVAFCNSTLGTTGYHTGKLCYSPVWEANLGPYVNFHGIKSGATIKIRGTNFCCDMHPELHTLTKIQIYQLIKDDPDYWCDWSNTLTVTFSTSTTPGKGKKK